MIIFGATGDLAKKKLLPALHSLHGKGIRLPVQCVGRRRISRERYLDFMGIRGYDAGFLSQISYHRMDLEDPIRGGIREDNLFYYALSPDLFERAVEVTRKLAGPDKRVVFEKPFGHDLASARRLNKCIGKVFSEDEIYRIDHYLGKELVQNILVFRFANSIFEQIWNRNFIDHIQITMAESIGVESRAEYYDNAGAVRDMLQNHVLQVVSLAAMEPPKSMKADDIRDEKARLLRKVAITDVVLGQYGPGLIDGKRVGSYLDDIGHKSGTETFVSAQLNIDNKRWKGVPFFVRTGKRIAKRGGEINIVLKDVSCTLFSTGCGSLPNIITIRIQPDEGISILFNAKTPQGRLEQVKMDFCHRCRFGENTPEAYEVLLTEIIKGDQTQFTRWDCVEASWKLIDPFLGRGKLHIYRAGSQGPQSSVLREGRKWI
ncbi:MAG: glucose-6-phosphate dehydrogenase [archaeon]